MSTKTLKKRIALVAVSALTAGVLSVASTPVANAGVNDAITIADIFIVDPASAGTAEPRRRLCSGCGYDPRT